MIVSRNGLEGRGVRIGECAAWCAKDVAHFEVFKSFGRYQQECVRIESWFIRFVEIRFVHCFSHFLAVVIFAELFFGRLMALQLLHLKNHIAAGQTARSLVGVGIYLIPHHSFALVCS
jgi:hypothetical protein